MKMETDKIIEKINKVLTERRVIGFCLILILLAFLLGGCQPDNCNSIDSQQITIPYCEHQGYTMKINDNNRPICVFDDGTNCTTDDFYLSTAKNQKCIYDINTMECALPEQLCGLNKTREFRQRKLCESVYIEFEKCEEGLIPSETEYVLEVSHCKKG